MPVACAAGLWITAGPWDEASGYRILLLLDILTIINNPQCFPYFPPYPGHPFGARQDSLTDG